MADFDGLRHRYPKIFDFVGFNGAINDFFGGSGVRALPEGFTRRLYQNLRRMNASASFHDGSS